MRQLSFSRKKIEPREFEKELEALSKRLKLAIGEAEIYLFGSAAERPFFEDSDFDILIVARDIEELKSFQSKIRDHHPIVHRTIDFVWMLKSDFERKKKIGGVAFTCLEINHRL